MKFNVILSVLLGVNIFMAPSLAEARPSVPIVNQENVAATTGSGKIATAAQFKQALISGGATRQWTVVTQPDGAYLATVVVRNKHTLAAKVTYADGKFSIVYHSSDKLDYFVGEMGPVIHPNANSWMLNLKDAIRVELLKI